MEKKNIVKLNKIKARMAELELTQMELAKKIGMNVRTLRFKLNGQMRMYVEDVAKLIVALQLTPKETCEYFFNQESVKSDT